MDKYFNAAACIAGYEEHTGQAASEYLAAAVMELEPIINRAYHAGYVAGVKAAATLEATQKQTGSET